MDKYKKVEKKKVEQEIKPNEIRVTTQGKMRNYLTYAINLLTADNPPEGGEEGVILRAMGGAIVKTVSIAEILKRRVPDLHQITEIDSNIIIDYWEPTEEGLDPIETERHVSAITIRLMKTAPENTAEIPGYQPPLEEVEVVPQSAAAAAPRRGKNRRRGRGRGRGGLGRGGKGPRGAPEKDDQPAEDIPKTEVAAEEPAAAEAVPDAVVVEKKEEVVE